MWLDSLDSKIKQINLTRQIKVQATYRVCPVYEPFLNVILHWQQLSMSICVLGAFSHLFYHLVGCRSNVLYLNLQFLLFIYLCLSCCSCYILCIDCETMSFLFAFAGLIKEWSCGQWQKYQDVIHPLPESFIKKSESNISTWMKKCIYRTSIGVRNVKINAIQKEKWTGH